MSELGRTLSEAVERLLSFHIDASGKLIIRGPKASLSPANVARLRERKAEILAVLAEAPDPELRVEGPPCTRCRTTAYRDFPVHGGLSTRRDCAKCGLALGFVRWYGEAVER